MVEEAVTQDLGLGQVIQDHIRIIQCIDQDLDPVIVSGSVVDGGVVLGSVGGHVLVQDHNTEHTTDRAAAVAAVAKPLIL